MVLRKLHVRLSFGLSFPIVQLSRKTLNCIKPSDENSFFIIKRIFAEMKTYLENVRAVVFPRTCSLHDYGKGSPWINEP